MNNKINVIIIATLLVIIVGMVAGFSYLQQEISQLNPKTPTQSPKPSETPTQIPTPTSYSTPTPKTTPTKVVYEWHLKPEYINNVTWLNQSMTDIFSKHYDSSKTWSENYIQFIDSFWEIPQQYLDSGMGALAGAYLIQHLPVNTSFDESTGLTIAEYQYAESNSVPLHYVIESILPTIADNSGWTRNLN
jgi:hypothetical protein